MRTSEPDTQTTGDETTRTQPTSPPSPPNHHESPSGYPQHHSTEHFVILLVHRTPNPSPSAASETPLTAWAGELHARDQGRHDRGPTFTMTLPFLRFIVRRSERADAA